MRLIVFILVFLSSNFFLSCLFSQTYPQNDFISPVGDKMLISGDFGEIRSNHFHSGVDFRTRVNPKGEIFAVADGYVSRINVSAWGYGNAVYITHNNGYKSVYGHLEYFNQTITEYLETKQYARQEFALNLYPNPDELPVKQGEFIGRAGNTGYSFGEHLHFEIRDSRTDEPINPLLFGWNIADDKKPEFRNLAIYPLDDSSFVAGKNAKKIIKTQGANGKFVPQENNIVVSGNIIFGIEAYDYFSNIESENGVYSVRLYKNNELIYQHFVNKFSFFESRYINTFIDYQESITSGLKIQRSYIAPNNKLNFYQNTKNAGVCVFTNDSIYEMKYVISDIKGNESELTFKVKSIANIKAKYEYIKNDYTMLMNCKTDNYYISDDLRLTVHRNSLYENLYFYYSHKSSKDTEYSDIHYIHNSKTPLHMPMTISIDASKVPQDKINKAIIVTKNSKNEIESIGGKYMNGFITAKSKNFGLFYITLDTTPPIVTPLNISEKKDMTGEKNIKFKVTDNMKKIDDYSGYIDSTWFLFKYDGKNDLIYYDIDHRLSTGKHVLKFVATDACGNETVYKTNFIYTTK